MADANVKNTETPARTHYEVLGVKQDATTELIDTTYNNLKTSIDPSAANAEENLKKLKEAHDILANEEQRRLYDASLPKPEPKPTDDKDEPAPQADANPKKSMFYAEPKQDDDPMVALCKELLNMLLEKYEEKGLMQAMKDQYKQGWELANNLVDWLDKPQMNQTQTQANTNTPTPDTPVATTLLQDDDTPDMKASSNTAQTVLDDNYIELDDLSKDEPDDKLGDDEDHVFNPQPNQ